MDITKIDKVTFLKELWDFLETSDQRVRHLMKMTQDLQSREDTLITFKEGQSKWIYQKI